MSKMLVVTWLHHGYSCTDMSRAYLTIPSIHTFAAEHSLATHFHQDKLCIIICAFFFVFFTYTTFEQHYSLEFHYFKHLRKYYFVLLQLIRSELLGHIRSLNKPNLVGKILDTIYFESQYHSINPKISAKYDELGTLDC